MVKLTKSAKEVRGRKTLTVKVKTANGGSKKMYVCTSCLRSGKVERA